MIYRARDTLGLSQEIFQNNSNFFLINAAHTQNKVSMDGSQPIYVLGPNSYLFEKSHLSVLYLRTLNIFLLPTRIGC